MVLILFQNMLQIDVAVLVLDPHFQLFFNLLKLCIFHPQSIIWTLFIYLFILFENSSPLCSLVCSSKHISSMYMSILIGNLIEFLTVNFANIAPFFLFWIYWCQFKKWSLLVNLSRIIYGSSSSKIPQHESSYLLQPYETICWNLQRFKVPY